MFLFWFFSFDSFDFLRWSALEGDRPRNRFDTWQAENILVLLFTAVSGSPVPAVVEQRWRLLDFIYFLVIF